MKTKRVLSLLLALSLAASLAAPAFAAEEIPALPEEEITADVSQSGGLAGLYDQFTLDFAAQYKQDHPEEYADFDAEAWFTQEWGFYDKAEYMADMGLTTEEEFWEDMWVEYLTYTEEYEAAWAAHQTLEEARMVEEYRADHPGELEGLDLTALLERMGYREPLAAYMDDFDIATEEEARTRLLAGYVSNRLEVQERRDQAEAYRAADPESWENFDVDAYLAEEWPWYTKEEFMTDHWAGPFDTEEELADYLYIEFMEGGNTPWGWAANDEPVLVVNGQTRYDAGLTAADGVSYLPAGELGTILGVGLAGEEPVAIREAALAAGWDVVWNQHRNEVVLLDREKLTRGLIMQEEDLADMEEDEMGQAILPLMGQREGNLFVQDFSRFDEMMNRLLPTSQTKEGQSYRTTETVDLTLTAFNSLDGDRKYDFTIKADMVVRDSVMDLTLTANAAQMLELLGQPAVDKLSAQLPKFTFQNLKTLLAGCKAEMIVDMEAGRAYWNIPLLSLFDDTVSEDTWYSLELPEGKTQVAMTGWSTGEVLYESLLSSSATSYWGASDAYSDYAMTRIGANLFLGSDTITEKNGTLTWTFDAQRLTKLMETVDPWGEAPALDGMFKELELTISVDRNGRFDITAAVRPDMDAIAALATQSSWYDATEAAAMTWALNLLDFRYAVHNEGTANRATGTGEVHWKNQFRLDISSASTRTESRTAPRTTPPAGAEIVEL